MAGDKHKTLRFDGVKYYVPHGARAVTIDGEKHYLCVPVKGRGAVRAVRACEVDAALVCDVNSDAWINRAAGARSDRAVLVSDIARRAMRAISGSTGQSTASLQTSSDGEPLPEATPMSTSDGVSCARQQRASDVRAKGHSKSTTTTTAGRSTSFGSARLATTFTPTRFERRWIAILGATLALLAALLGCR